MGEIGRGAYGTVYRAWDTRLAREVALKVPGSDDSAASLGEARRLARVKHPNVVTIFGADEVDGQFGLWMELLRGRTLDTIVRDQGPFSAREAVAIFHDICGAVAAIHRAGLIHRDIKAQNVMREFGGRHVLIDLGASVDITRDAAAVTTLAGTPLYMAPELFEGQPANVSSGYVTAIGVLFYRLVTADFPLRAETIGDVRRAHAAGAVRPLREVRPGLSPTFIDLVERCMARDPAARFSNIAALERAVASLDGRSPSSHGRWRQTAVSIAAPIAAIAIAAIASGFGALSVSSRSERNTSPPSISPEQYQVFSAYEELAFDRRLEDPAAAATAVGSAMAQIRHTFAGNRPIFALLYGRMSNSARQAGDLKQADSHTNDAGIHAQSSVGEVHPFSAVLAMEMARNARAAGNTATAAEQLVRALNIRERVLGWSEIAGASLPALDLKAFERSVVLTRSLEADSDGDGLLDVVESVIGLSPRSVDSDRDGVLDDDESVTGSGVSNRLRFGLVASPYLTWSHYGAYDPRYLGWQSPANFPMIQRAETVLSQWFIEAAQSQTYFLQRLSRAQSRAAVERGFSLFVRVQPVQSLGYAAVAIDTAPVGPRFNVTAERITDRLMEIKLLSSIVPLKGLPTVVEAPLKGVGPLIEVRYRPQWGSASLFVNGQRRRDGYSGLRQFQGQDDGLVAWAVAVSESSQPRAAGAFNLVWLEIY